MIPERKLGKLGEVWNQMQIPADEWKGVHDWAEKQIDLDLDEQGRIVKPDIEGTYGFDRVWGTNTSFLELLLETRGSELKARQQGIPLHHNAEPAFQSMAGTARNAFYALSAMQQSHTIAVDPEQIAVLPHWESMEEAVDYGAHAKLPFDTVFLDCELPIRQPPPADTQFGDKYQLLNAIVGVDAECLIILPFGVGHTKMGGRLVKGDSDEWDRDGIDVDYLSLGAVTFNLAKDPEAPRADTFDNSLPFVQRTSRSMGADYQQWEMDLRWFGQQIEGQDPDDRSFSLDGAVPLQGPPSPCRVIVIPPRWDSADAGTVAGTAAMLLAGAFEVLKILYFLDTPNIELADTQMSRQVRRSAERRGATISKTIFVRHNTKRSPRKDDDQTEHIEYSHRFEVRGHWKYYPEGTQMADARPDLLRYVPGRGMCRKIWCPPHVKGPEDRPLVPKTRRLREDRGQGDA